MMIIANLFKCTFSQVNTLTRYLQPVRLPLKEALQIPTLQLKS